MKTNISLAKKWIVSIYIDIIQEVFQIPKTKFKDSVYSDLI